MVLSLILLALLFPLAGQSVNCAHDPTGKIFERYQSLTDEQIGKDCTYDLSRHEPNASASDFNVNERRTSNCENGLRRMRETSQRYLTRKSQICGGIQNAPACTDANDQAACLADAGDMSAGTQRGQEELGNILQGGQDEITDLAQFHRLRTKKFMRDLETLRRMSRRQKIGGQDLRRGVHTSGDDRPPQNMDSTVSSRPTTPQPKPTPSSADSLDTPGRSTVSRAGRYQPLEEMRPQDAGVKTLSEYEQRLPYLIREHEASLKKLNEFQEASSAKTSEHRAMASTFAVRAAKLFLAAEKMGHVEEGQLQWEKENPKAVAEAKAQMAAAPTEAPGEPAELDGGMVGESMQTAQMSMVDEEQDSRAAAQPMNEATSMPEEPGEDPALESFTAKLPDESKAPKVIAERARLRELLRQRMRKEAGAPSEKVPGEIVGEILAEAKAEFHRAPAAATERKEGVGTIDVETALADIEGQLRELDRQAGILESETSSLFERVRSQLKRRQKELVD